MKKYLTKRFLRLPDNTLPHMGVKGDGDVAPYVLLSGNPARVYIMKDFLEDVHQIGSERGAVVFTGIYQGVLVTVASTGMGCPSLAISLEELAAAGGKTFIRTGSCASISEDINIGDLIVAIASVRDEGTSSYYAPTIFPAVANYYVTRSICEVLDQKGESYHLGVIRSTDSFYEGERKEEVIEFWHQRSVLAFEMEASGLFTISTVLGLRSGAILVPGSNLITGVATYQGQEVEASKTGVEKMIIIALEALVTLASKDGDN
jgi:uridine phosphorylase